MDSEDECPYCLVRWTISIADGLIFEVCTNPDCPGPIDYDDNSDLIGPEEGDDK